MNKEVIDMKFQKLKKLSSFKPILCKLIYSVKCTTSDQLIVILACDSAEYIIFIKVKKNTKYTGYKVDMIPLYLVSFLWFIMR